MGMLNISSRSSSSLPLVSGTKLIDWRLAGLRMKKGRERRTGVRGDMYAQVD